MTKCFQKEYDRLQKKTETADAFLLNFKEIVNACLLYIAEWCQKNIW